MTLMLAAASICATDALERQRVPPEFECCDETFWDAQSLDIEACANFDDFPDPENCRPGKNYRDWMLGIFFKGGNPQQLLFY